MFLTKKHIARRTFLRGAGVTLALPLLESMVPAQTPLAKSAAAPVRRLAFCYIPHGMIMAKFTPPKEGAGLDVTPILQPVQAFKDQMTIVSNLSNRFADDGATHAGSPPSWLAAVRVKKTEGEDVYAGTTIDQLAARQIGQTTVFPSLEVAVEDTTGLVGACDTGYSCTYLNSISWRGPTTPNPMETNPRVVFDRLFGEGSNASERRARMEEDRSILDGVANQIKKFTSSLGGRDRAVFSDYLDDIREIERRIQLSEQRNNALLGLPESPVGIPDDYDEHVKILFDLQVLAHQADLTRISTFMMARELSSRTYPQAGAPVPHHATSHHQNDPAKIADLIKIQTYHMGLLAYFLDKLRKTEDGQGTLLDHSLVMYGSNMSNSNLHDHSPLPVVLAGGAAGALQGNRHMKYKEETPLANLLVTVLDKFDVHVDSVGNSNGRLAGL
jgi:hypothetical protein